MEFVNDNQKERIKVGGRTAPKISQKELIKRILEEYKKYFDEEEEYEVDSLNDIPQLKNIIPAIKKDLSVIEFDEENFNIDPNNLFGNYDKEHLVDNLVGIHTLENGFTFLGCQAGGDWECEIFYVVYWDGKKIRAYFPPYGNTHNSDFMTAFGSECGNERLSEKQHNKILQTYIDAGLSPKFNILWSPLNPTVDPLKANAHDIKNWLDLFCAKYGLAISDIQPNWKAIKQNLILKFKIV